MPDSATVWLWRPGADRGDRGTLSLEEDALRFTGDDGARLRIPRSDLEGVRRHRATPVLEIRYRDREERRVALLFFAKPPTGPNRATTLSVPFASPRGARRAAAMMSLREENPLLQPVVRAWARAIGA